MGSGVNDHLHYNNNSANKQGCKNDARHHVGEDIAVREISFAIFATLHTRGSRQGAFYNIDEAWFLGGFRFWVVHLITLSIGGVVKHGAQDTFQCRNWHDFAFRQAGNLIPLHTADAEVASIRVA